jgi:GH24 family phage-related lysozyme (muramidase)
MSDITRAINLIRKYEGFNEKAYPDPYTGAEPYTFGYGTQFYPDGSPVKQGQYCTKEKALEYLFHEAHIIELQLQKLNLGLDDCMLQALISFVHSIGWEAFLYSELIDCIEREDFFAATQAIGNWIFDPYHKVIGGLIDRRREEIDLFLLEVDANPWASTDILLTAFRNYSAAPHQLKAIRQLEEHISPYVLSEFANAFEIDSNPWEEFSQEELDAMFAM